VNEINSGNINQGTGKYKRKFLLLEKGKLGKEILSYLADKESNNHIDICFEDEEFIFLFIKV
jgi:hypothetical protein